jgi:hypothetical protein
MGRKIIPGRKYKGLEAKNLANSRNEREFNMAKTKYGEGQGTEEKTGQSCKTLFT